MAATHAVDDRVSAWRYGVELQLGLAAPAAQRLLRIATAHLQRERQLSADAAAAAAPAAAPAPALPAPAAAASAAVAADSGVEAAALALANVDAAQDSEVATGQAACEELPEGQPVDAMTGSCPEWQPEMIMTPSDPPPANAADDELQLNASAPDGSAHPSQPAPPSPVTPARQALAPAEALPDALPASADQPLGHEGLAQPEQQQQLDQQQQQRERDSQAVATSAFASRLTDALQVRLQFHLHGLSRDCFWWTVLKDWPACQRPVRRVLNFA